jgi:hypothetical protein
VADAGADAGARLGRGQVVGYGEAEGLDLKDEARGVVDCEGDSETTAAIQHCSRWSISVYHSVIFTNTCVESDICLKGLDKLQVHAAWWATLIVCAMTSLMWWICCAKSECYAFSCRSRQVFEVRLDISVIHVVVAAGHTIIPHINACKADCRQACSTHCATDDLIAVGVVAKHRSFTRPLR